MRIRSITLFANVTPELDDAQFAVLGAFAKIAREAYEAAGYVVQTIRLATDMFPALQRSRWADDPAAFGVALESTCLAHGFEYVALGPAGSPQLPQLPALLEATQSTFVTAHILDPTTGTIDGNMIRGAARVICQAAEIQEGFGNLRFAALANVMPGSPFFPSAYHDDGAPSFALATEAADLAVQACAGARDAGDASARLVSAIERHAGRLVAVAKDLRSHSVEPVSPRFRGIDFSLAPFPVPEASIGAALEALRACPKTTSHSYN